MNRELTDKQHAKLDRVADEEPHATVIGWEHTSKSNGPIIRRLDGTVKVINPNGYAINPRF